MSKTIGEISIPSDSDGLELFQCPLCRSYFKLVANDVNADDVIEITCPSCGLKSENYLTSDVIEVAKTKAINYLLYKYHDEAKKLERSFNGRIVSFSAGAKPKHELEGKLYCGKEALDIEKYPCCKREAKIDPLLKFCGSFCPYCGVRYEGNK